MNKILVLNSGSSSIKVKIFNSDLSLLLEALIERIGQNDEKSIMTVKWQTHQHSDKYLFPTHARALSTFLDFLKNHKIIEDFNKEISAIGHRIVMGGDLYQNPTLVNQTVLKDLNAISHLAPLHNPANILGIKQMQKLVDKPNVIVCDTGFHQSLKATKYLYSLPYEMYQKEKIRKYGMHGISYQYTTKMFSQQTKILKPNLIIFHLGNGCSVSAVKHGQSFNTSMGLTPLAGLMMGTRSGDIDPAIVTFLQRQLKKNVDQIDEILNKKSGLLGISQMTNDMRDIVAAKNNDHELAKLAFNIFIDRLVRFYTEYVNDLENKIDGIIFTGGIGYNSADVVQAFVEQIKISNLKLQKNWTNERKGWQKISDSSSQFNLYISETNEELEIAKQTRDLLSHPAQSPLGKNHE